MKPYRHFVILTILCIIVTGAVSAASSSDDVQAGLASTQPANSFTTGSIFVVSTPPGASAVLDGGADLLYTPGTFTGVNPGIHNVLISRPGFQPHSSRVTVTAGTTSNVNVDLPQVINPGGISLSTDPKGVGFYVDEIYQGKTNQVVGNLAPGPHKVGIYETDYVVWEDTVTVVAGEITPVTVTLVKEQNPDTGDLQVSSSPSGAAVYVNGDFRGVTPTDDSLDVVNLAPATYTITLKKTGYNEYSKIITIQAGRDVRTTALLVPSDQPPSTASAQVLSTPGGAEVWVNGQFMGDTPLTFQKVPEGQYTIEIRMNGYAPYTTTGQVNAGQNLQLTATLVPLPSATPTKKAGSSPSMVIAAIGILCLAGYLACRR